MRRPDERFPRSPCTASPSGDNGAGLSASHQTGWTGIVARSMHLFATTTAEQVLELGKAAAIVEVDG